MVKGIATNDSVISLITGQTNNRSVCTRQITDSSFYPIIGSAVAIDIRWMDKTDNEKHFVELLRLNEYCSFQTQSYMRNMLNRRKY